MFGFAGPLSGIVLFVPLKSHLIEDLAAAAEVTNQVVQACERGTTSQAEVARFFGVSRSFVEKLL
jgi:predicted XRE-type DNA-binding protein